MSRAVPKGTIQAWSGAIVDIPSRWRLCDGTNGTPDLRDKFVVGAGSAYAVGAAGGNVNHVHPFTGNGHAHLIGPGTDIKGGIGVRGETPIDPVTGTTDTKDGRPPYYSLAFIMYKGVP